MRPHSSARCGAKVSPSSREQPCSRAQAQWRVHTEFAVGEEEPAACGVTSSLSVIQSCIPCVCAISLCMEAVFPERPRLCHSQAHAISSQVPALQVTESRDGSLPSSGKVAPSTASGTASLQASAETDGLAKSSSPLARQTSGGRASWDGRPGSAGRPPLPPGQRSSPQYPLPGQSSSPPQANGALRSQVGSLSNACHFSHPPL